MRKEIIKYGRSLYPYNILNHQTFKYKTTLKAAIIRNYFNSLQMKRVNTFNFKPLLQLIVIVVFLLSISDISAQETKSKQYPKDVSIEEQFNQVVDQSSRWENYKMITENWINTLRRNTLDSIKNQKKEISECKVLLAQKDSAIAKLESSLSETIDALSLAQREKNSMVFLGMKIMKSAFLTIIGLIIGILAISLFVVFGLYKTSFFTIKKARTELDETKNEFESYRQESRKKYEEMVKQHHKEIQKMKGN